MKVSGRDLSLLGWIHPWLSLLGLISFFAEKQRLDFRLLGAVLILLITFPAIFFNPSLMTFANFVGLFLLQFFRPKFSLSRFGLMFIRVFLASGILSALFLKFQGGGRVGLFGGEPNFTAFTAFLGMIALLSIGRRIEAFFIFVLVLSLTVSKTFLISGAILGVLRVTAGSRWVSLAIAFSIIAGAALVSYFQAEGALPEGLKSFQMGYSDGYERLFFLIDSSFVERVAVQLHWVNFLSTVDAWTLLFGDPLAISTSYEMVPHNSFLQKTLDQGLLFVVLFTLISLRYLKVWIVFPYFFFCFFLHGILSVGVLFMLFTVVFGGDRAKVTDDR